MAGEEFFQNLTDEYGTAVTKRQAQTFQEKIATLDVEIAFFSSSIAEDAFPVWSWRSKEDEMRKARKRV